MRNFGAVILSEAGASFLPLILLCTSREITLEIRGLRVPKLAVIGTDFGDGDSKLKRGITYFTSIRGIPRLARDSFTRREEDCARIGPPKIGITSTQNRVRKSEKDFC